jgi:hypothetical protein
MVIVLPSTEDGEWYRAGRASRAHEVPRIVDDEAVCPVRVLDTGSSTLWSRGDVELHLLYAKQHGLVDEVAPVGWLASALRERREQRLRLLRRGVQTTASGLVVLQPRAELLLPSSP